MGNETSSSSAPKSDELVQWKERVMKQCLQLSRSDRTRKLYFLVMTRKEEEEEDHKKKEASWLPLLPPDPKAVVSRRSYGELHVAHLENAKSIHLFIRATCYAYDRVLEFLDRKQYKNDFQGPRVLRCYDVEGRLRLMVWQSHYCHPDTLAVGLIHPATGRLKKLDQVAFDQDAVVAKIRSWWDQETGCKENKWIRDCPWFRLSHQAP